MSYQTSIHFDPTALLIIKNEIDNSIKLVETAVNTLAEEQAFLVLMMHSISLSNAHRCLPWLICRICHRSPSIQLSWCARSWLNRSKSRLVMWLPSVKCTTMLKRYIEFICLREVKVPQSRWIPWTVWKRHWVNRSPKKRQTIQPLLDCITPHFNLPYAPKSGTLSLVYSTSFTSYAWTSWLSRQKRLWTCRVLSLWVFTLQVWRQIFQVSNTGNWLMWV